MKWFLSALRHAFSRLLAHRWTYALPVATLLLPATIYAVRMPDTYQARALVRVREMSTGEYGSRLPTEQGARAFATVSTVRDRLITMRTLQAIMPILAPATPADDAVALDKLKERIEFDRMSDYSFSIAISDQSADRASEATNKLLQTFLSEEREPLLRRARDRRAFYDREVADATEAHIATSRALSRYRNEHADVLPELKDVVSNELTALRAEARVQTQLAAAARRRADFLSEQIARGGTTTPKGPLSASTSADEKRLEQQLTEQQSLLSAARKRLAEARTRHTEKMPDVISLRTEVSGLTADVKVTVAALQAAHKRTHADASRLEKAQSAEALGMLRRLRTESLEEAQGADQIDDELRIRIKGLEVRLAKIPATAAGLAPLLEDLADADGRRDALQGSASAAAEREEYLAGSSAEDVTPYQVAQWAVPPAKPNGPKRMAILLTAIGLGGLIGYGLMLLRRNFEEELVFAPEQLRPLLPDAMVVSVPLLEGGQPRRSLRWQELIPVTWVTACLVLTIWTLAAHKGLMTAPAWLEGLMGRAV